MVAQGLWRSHGDDPQEAVRHLTAMQAQEHSYARWSVAQRAGMPLGVRAIDRAFDEGRILRTHVLRPTWHYVAPQDLDWLMKLSGPRVHARNARGYAALGLGAKVLARTSDIIAKAVDGAPQTRKDIAAILERKGISVAGQRIAYILMHAELHAMICSGPMRKKQHTYAAFYDRVPRATGPEGDDALAHLALRFFTTRGPATLTDFVWWSGLGTADARRALEVAGSRLVSRPVDSRTYWFAEQTVPRVSPAVDLVQCFDEAIISYSQTRDILQTRLAAFPVPRHIDGFTHVVLLDGRLLGHWRPVQHRESLSVETRIQKNLNRREKIALADAIDRYVAFAEAPPARSK